MFSFLPEQIPSIWVALAIVIAFVFACAKPLRAHPLPFYILFTVAEVLYVDGTLKFSTALHDLNQVFSSCYTGVAMYLVVMFAGAFDKKLPWVKTLMSVRSELSIIGGIIIMGHTVLVAVLPLLALTGFWWQIWGAAAPAMFLATVVVGLPLLVCFLVPWITSFKFVRRRLDHATWKKTQRFAYPFMALLVLQGILLSLGHAIYRFQDTGGTGDLTGYVLNLATYLALGIAYLVLKVRQRAHKKRTPRMEQGIPQQKADR